MSLDVLVNRVVDKTNFDSLSSYIDFARSYLDYIERQRQAVILCQNERDYLFFQYGDDGHRNVTRPLNGKLWLKRSKIDQSWESTTTLMRELRNGQRPAADLRAQLVPTVYTLQQAIGSALDALPSGQTNRARKVNGDLFERLVRLLINECGVTCAAGTVRVPVKDADGAKLFDVNYQRDLVVEHADKVVLIGSVKTSSKDRIDKVFIDKFFYNRLTESQTPHIAIYLNDVQRAGALKAGRYKVSGTFLPGRFKGYSLRLNAMDGVYYCDMRPNMTSDAMLAEMIKPFDRFICHDLFDFIAASRGVEVEFAPGLQEEGEAYEVDV